MKRYKVVQGSVLFLVLSLGGQAVAQVTTGLDSERFKPTLDSQGLILTEGGQGENAGDFNLGFYLHYSHRPLVIGTEDDVTRDLVSERVGGNLFGSLGIFSWLSVAVDIPAVLFQEGERVDAAMARTGGIASVALGDIRLVPKVTLLRQKTFGVSLALSVPFSLPTGDDEAYSGSKIVTASPTLALSRTFLSERLLLAANVGMWFFKGVHSDLLTRSALDAQSELFYRTGLEVRFTPAWSVTGEVFGAGKMSNLFNNRSNETPLEWLGGLRWRAPRDVIVSVGGGSGILQGWGTPNYRAFVGIMWSPRAHEQPRIGDRDKDGILDNVDKCPDDPEDMDGFQDEDGCPDPDNDNDGILDVDDKCPNVPEDKDGFQDEDGCPDPDNDKDGILDVADKCPNDPETINGIDDLDGCPDEGAPKVVLQEEKIEIRDMIHFEFNKSIIKEESFGLLDQIAQIIRGHTELTRIRIEGHCDFIGSEEYNQGLSERRAAAVREYLITRGGVDAARLLSVGFGKTRPIAPNSSDEGRTMNRRVEFIIIEHE